jgi:hypothetical protein
MADAIVPDVAIHRIGGGHVANLRLSAIDRAETPPGISVLLGATPQDAAAQMRRAFPRSKKWDIAARVVASASLTLVNQAGFDVIPDPTDRFPNHGRLIHPHGEAGFDDANLTLLSQVFVDRAGC